jgi:hypothetical protein
MGNDFFIIYFSMTNLTGDQFLSEIIRLCEGHYCLLGGVHFLHLSLMICFLCGL